MEPFALLAGTTDDKAPSAGSWMKWIKGRSALLGDVGPLIRRSAGRNLTAAFITTEASGTIRERHADRIRTQASRRPSHRRRVLAFQQTGSALCKVLYSGPTLSTAGVVEQERLKKRGSAQT